jgi:hypothetical protein
MSFLSFARRARQAPRLIVRHRDDRSKQPAILTRTLETERLLEDDIYYTVKRKTITDKLSRVISKAWKKEIQPGTLILVRHGTCPSMLQFITRRLHMSINSTGESEWNKQKRFTGWVDADLVEMGRQEVVTLYIVISAIETVS